MAIDLRSSALAACRAALRPLIRMLLEHGVMHREFVELSKEIYVDVARRHYGIRGRPTNLSRTALLTGLDRKEVGRIRRRLSDAQETARREGSAGRQDRISRLLSGWHQDPEYLQGDGKPLTLPMSGPAPSYESLVKRYAGDVPGITILRELGRTGAVRLHDDNTVEVLRRNYRLDAMDPETLARAGSVWSDLGTTVAHNLYHEPSEPSRFEARVTNLRVPKAALPAYRDMVYAECQVLLEKIDAWLSTHESDARNAADAQRVGLGMYWIQSDDSMGGSS